MSGQASTRPERGILHDKLRDQVTLSIRGALTKATGLLSSLHRVHSYLDLLQSVSSLSGCGEGVKGVLEQVRTIRTDTAALLQTIYITEIGLESLEQVENTQNSAESSSSSASARKVTVVPIVTDAISDPLSGGVADDDGAIDSNNGDVMQGGVVLDQFETSPQIAGPILQTSSQQPTKDSLPPPAKKQNIGVVIARCVECKRKYATDQLDPQMGGKCKICRSKGAPSNQSPPLVLLGPALSSTPQRLIPGGVKNKVRKIATVPMSCKVCGASFVYRRCLFRHLRENHPDIDVSNIHQHVETESVTAEEISLVNEGAESRNTSLNVTVGSEVSAPSDVDESVSESPITSLLQVGGVLQVGRVSQVGEVSQVGGVSEVGKVEEEGTVRYVNFDPTVKVYTCTICGKVFDRPYRLLRHVNIHDPNRPRVSCHLCERTFTRFDTLENHIKSVHSKEHPFQCQFNTCQKTFATQTALMSHLKVHTNGKPYQCLECDASFSLLVEYKMHAKQKHPDTERLRCTDCYRVFPDTASLEEHRNQEHLFECEICGKKFARLAYLQLHVQVHNGEKVYNCRVCSQGFDSESAYRQHLKSHPKPSRANMFHCQLCDCDFGDPSELIAHNRCSEHREKAAALGLGENTTLLNTIEGDFSDMNALVDEVAMVTNPIAMETTPVAMPTDPKQVGLEVNPAAVLGGIEPTTPPNMMAPAIAHTLTFHT